MHLLDIAGGGGLGTCDIWNGEDWCGENFVPILNYHGKIWSNVPDCGTRTTHTATVGLDACCHFVIPVEGGTILSMAVAVPLKFLFLIILQKAGTMNDGI